MRFIALTFLSLLTACASTAQYPHNVPTTQGGLISTDAYNREIRAQGIEHYCANQRCDSLPLLLLAYAPVYPQALQARGVTGQATITLTIGIDGTTDDFVVESASAPEFAASSIAALRQWRFQPATLNKTPIPMSFRQQFPFDLR